MKQLLLLYRFNPYHNRRIIRYSTINEYIGNPNNEAEHIAAGSYIFCEYPKNFAYRDGVDTVTKATLDNALETPDYCLVINQTTQEIESRWFIMDSDLYSGKSTQLTLHRDMIADYYEEVLTAPCFIEKATLNPADPFIFNSENITVNRIKKGETLIKDKSKCAWVVGYLSSGAATTQTTINSPEAQEVMVGYTDAATFLVGFPYSSYVEFGSNSEGLPTAATNFDTAASGYTALFGITRDNYISYGAGFNPYGLVSYRINPSGAVSRTYQANYATEAAMAASAEASLYQIAKAAYHTTGLGIWDSYTQNAIKNSLSNKASQFMAGCRSYFNKKATADLLTRYDGQNIKIGDKYYKLELKRGTAHSQLAHFGTTTSNDIVNAINGMSVWNSVDQQSSQNCLTAVINWYDYYLKATEISSSQLQIILSGNERVCGKLPYKMFCIPYSVDGDIEIRVGTESTYETINMVRDLAISAAKALSIQYSGSQTLYDIQLLPYCPDQNIIVDDHIILVPNNNTAISYIYDANVDKSGVIYWCANNTGTIDIEHEITVDDVKMDSITEMHRISSPNWNGQFEFNAAKNGGVSKLNVDFTYKPHCPYIHINPNFGRLYGEDFDDARGLICAGDFSLPQTSDAWNTYEIQNKNYQNQFQRDIDSLELTQTIQMKQQKFAAIAGVVAGGISGATAGGAVGGIGGGVAGAVAGAALSGVGAAVDIKYQKQLNEEAIDYKQDQFGFQLENIKALPQNLTNVGGMTANNKIWPVVEHYSCTDEEKQAIELKLHYNGMTVERIGTMADFLQDDYSYIKGKLIRLTINEDNHFIEMIANEINRGVFIK